MKLSKRLNALASFVDESDIVADIGCDHAQLCCALVLHKNIAKAYACDVAEGPLLQAKNNIEYYKLQNRIATVLGDGLDRLSEDVNCIVIAGMGFETVCHILDSNLQKLQGRKCIVQVNRDVEGLRQWISDHHFTILHEKCVLEDHYYQIIVFNTGVSSPLNKDEILFGKEMIHDFDFYSFWKYNLMKQEKILCQLDESHPRYPEVRMRMRQIYQLFGS